MICFFLPGGPTIAVRSSRASSGVKGWSARPTNSENKGTALILSLKYVGRRLGAGGSAVEASVANDLEELETKARETCRKGGAFRHLNLTTVAAIVSI